MRGPGTTYLTLPMGMLAFALAAACYASSCREENRRRSAARPGRFRVFDPSVE
jgi:hypothetical protein